MKTNIMGTAVATVQQMQSYIQKVNPAVPKSVIDMVEYYISEGKTEGVRGDIAFAQSCLETGNFTFNGSAVTLDQNNFAGIGVTKNFTFHYVSILMMNHNTVREGLKPLHSIMSLF